MWLKCSCVLRSSDRRVFSINISLNLYQSSLRRTPILPLTSTSLDNNNCQRNLPLIERISYGSIACALKLLTLFIVFWILLYFATQPFVKMCIHVCVHDLNAIAYKTTHVECVPIPARWNGKQWKTVYKELRMSSSESPPYPLGNAFSVLHMHYSFALVYKYFKEITNQFNHLVPCTALS